MVTIASGTAVIARHQSLLTGLTAPLRHSLADWPLSRLCSRCFHASLSNPGRKTTTSSPLYQFHLASNLLYGPVLNTRNKPIRQRPARSSGRRGGEVKAAASSTCSDESAQHAQTSAVSSGIPAAQQCGSEPKSEYDPFVLDYILCSSISDVTVNESRGMPSVTRILSDTMSPESRAALLRWQRRMEAELGMEGFQKLKRSMFATGRQLHRMIAQALCGSPPTSVTCTEESLDPDVDSVELDGFWRSLQPVLEHVSPDGVQMETAVSHPLLGYSGMLDTVADYHECSLLLEWKTVRRPRYSLASMYDAPVQAAAYLGAYNFQVCRQGGRQLSEAAVVAVDVSGRPARVMKMNEHECRHYWKLWLQRLKLYQESHGQDSSQ